MARLAHLEGLRGVACLQVVALHGFGAFLPGLVDGPAAGWELAVQSSPLRLLYDGDMAVFLFFVLSGHVLTAPFRVHAARPGRLVAGRVVRFLLPALMACTLSAAALWLLGGVAPMAGAVIGTGWLSGGLTGPVSAGALLWDATFNALVLGYRDMSVLTPWLGDTLWPNVASLDPPLWTLSVEMQGSLVVLALVLAERWARWLWWAGVAVGGVAGITSPLLCFVVGHILATWVPPPRVRLPMAVAGIALLLGDAGWAERVVALAPINGMPADLVAHGWAAMLLFPALLHARWSRALFARPALVRLGAISFPLYLVHWPMLFGPGAAALLASAPMVGVPAAGLVGLGVGLAASFAAAVPFRAIDRMALNLGRRLRAWPATQGSLSTTLAR